MGTTDASSTTLMRERCCINNSRVGTDGQTRMVLSNSKNLRMAYNRTQTCEQMLPLFIFCVSCDPFALNFCRAMVRWSVTTFIVEFNRRFNR